MMNVKEITDLQDPSLEIYTRLNEIQLKRYYEPDGGLFICENPKVVLRALASGYEPVSFLLENKYLGKEDSSPSSGGSLISEILQNCGEIPVYSAPLEVLVKLTGYHLTGGILCAMKRKPLLSAEDLLSGAVSENQPEQGARRSRIAVLEDIENPTNVGAIFRSAAALGVDAVLLTVGCSDPLYRRAARVSTGTVFQIPWTFLPEEKNAGSGKNLVSVLHSLGYKTAAMALSDNSVPIDDPRLAAEENLAVLFGNENNGLLPETIANSDYVVKIPMAEGIDSLNVAAASAVAFWQLRTP